jgi:wobble nucleotide-excising tRNase
LTLTAMSRITRINYVKQFWVFRNFTWPTDLPDFSRFNLIYGLNGSGKSVLSTLFQNIKTKQPLLEAQAQFRIDDQDVSLNSISPQSVLPKVRVFNKSFVDEAVFPSFSAEIAPVFYIGSKSVELQKGIEKLQEGLAQERAAKVRNESSKTVASNGLDDFCIQQAAAIKEILRSSGRNLYNNYDKSNFNNAVTAQAKVEPPADSVSQQRKDELLAEVRGSVKDSVTPILITFPDVDALTDEIRDVLKRTVVSTVLAELAANPTVANWVRDGLTLHTGENKSEACRFCGQSLPISRIEAIEAHFNDHFKQFAEGLDVLESRIESHKKIRKDADAPDKAALYDHLSIRYSELLQKLNENLSVMVTFLDALLSAARQKRNDAFQSLDLDPYIDSVQRFDRAKAEDIVRQVNDVIEQHNQRTKNFESSIATARKNVEKAYVIDGVPAFKTKSTAVDTLTSAVAANDKRMREIEAEIRELERQFVEHRLPAEELTAELASYLGRNEIRFEVARTGYSITRDGVRASNLSEGERTAIAFLYFLKTLQDKDFKVADDIVVIDDPVSSLDSNALFSAFGYMKERTRSPNQLFVFTHNFSFFRQVKNWFDHVNKMKKTKGDAQFYMLQSVFNGSQRNAVMAPLDKMLDRYASEYHYLFKRVVDVASSTAPEARLEAYYAIPNMARRLLESFLSFRYPSAIGKLYLQLESSSFDPGKRIRLLRFLDTYSHDSTVGDQGHDPSILAETPQVMRELLQFIEFEDQGHYQEMLKVVGGGQVQAAAASTGGQGSPN